MQQPADQRRLAVIDAAAGEKAQKILVAAGGKQSGQGGSGGAFGHRDGLALLGFHRTAASKSISRPCRSEVRAIHLGDDRLQRVGIRFDGRGQQIAAQHTETHLAHLGHFAGVKLHALVIDHDPLAGAADHRARLEKSSGTMSIASARMYCQTSSSVQLESGKTRINSPAFTRVL